MKSPSVAELVREARNNVRNMTIEEFEAAVGAGCVIVDLREPAELQETGIIPGAVAAPRGMIEFYADPASSYHRPEFDPDRKIVLYCASGGRSALAADSLQQLGYRDVGHLDGGLKAWIEAGRPISSAA